MLENSGRNSSDNTIVRKAFSDHRARSHHDVIAKGHARIDDAVTTQPNIITQGDGRP